MRARYDHAFSPQEAAAEGLQLKFTAAETATKQQHLDPQRGYP